MAFDGPIQGRGGPTKSMDAQDISSEYPAELSGRYVLEGLLAAGGMATVHAARDKSLGRKVALKLPHPHLWKDPRARERFLQEARLVASLSHENVVRLYDVGEDAGRLYLAMELVEGPSLDGVSRRIGPFPALAALETARQLFAGLQEAHSKDISHRDIKPSNLLLDRNGNLKIADFGLSRLTQSEGSGLTGGFAGTPRYASPELADGKPLTPRSDLFSAGLVLVELMIGHPLVPGDDPRAALLMVSRDDLSKRANMVLDEFRSESPPVLRELCRDLLNRDPALRPTAGDAFQRIESYALTHQLRMGKQRLAGLPDNLDALRQEESGDITAFWTALAEKAKAAGQAATARRFELLAAEGPAANGVAPLKRKPRPPQRLPDKMSLAVFLSLCVLWIMMFNQRKLSHWFYRTSGITPRAEILQQMVDDSLAALAKTLPAPPPESFIPQDTNAIIPPKTDSHPSPPPLPSQPAVLSHPQATAAVKSKPGSKSPSWLRVFSRPPHAEIWVDGVLRGSTPLAQPLQIGGGIHILKLVKIGCLPSEERLDLKPGDTLEIRRELVRKP